MRNGIELRENGTAKITRVENQVGYVSYRVSFLKNGKWADSKNGPWDYLGNARSDCGGYYDDIHRRLTDEGGKA